RRNHRPKRAVLSARFCPLGRARSHPGSFMRIRAFTPIHVGVEELQRRQERYNRLCPEGIQVELEDLPDTLQTPRELASPVQLRASENIGIELGSKTDPFTYDALLPDCVLDPGVEELDKITT